MDIPPHQIATAILSFFKKHDGSLRGGSKIATRRVWKQSTAKIHYRALVERLFVRCWVGGKGKQTGYIMYTKIELQQLGEMTEEDVVKEAATGMTVKEWKQENGFDKYADAYCVYVLEFIFIPLH